VKTIFKDVEGYEGRYQISNFGEVYSTPQDGKPSKLLKQETLKYGYKRVSLSKNGKVKRFTVHRLVALHFIDNVNNYPIVNHKDNNPSNNSSTNLEWCTQKDNIKHADVQGRRVHNAKAGGDALAVIYQEKTDTLLKEILRDRFIETVMVNGRKRCKFLCECGTEVTRRVDTLLVSNIHLCRPCTYKQIHKKDKT
jgi:hypothetical protein